MAKLNIAILKLIHMPGRISAGLREPIGTISDVAHRLERIVTDTQEILKQTAADGLGRGLDAKRKKHRAWSQSLELTVTDLRRISKVLRKIQTAARKQAPVMTIRRAKVVRLPP